MRWDSIDAKVAVAELEQAQSSWLASVGTASQANRAYTIAEVRYREGLSTQVDLADARVLLQQSEVNRAIAARDLQVARIKLALLRDLPLTTTGAVTTQQSAAQQQTQAQTQQSQSQQSQQQTQSAGAGGILTQTGNTGGSANP